MRGEINRLSKSLPSPDRSVVAADGSDSREADLDASTVSTSHGGGGGGSEAEVEGTAAGNGFDRGVSEKDISVYFNAEESDENSDLGSEDEYYLENIIRDSKKRK